jgi:diketogulonate reductase-like aldo/keto reductase
MDLKSTIKLNNGVEIPRVGFGTFKSPPGNETKQAVLWALEAGYRHVDTAAFYGNEEDVGKAVKESGISREDIFITTKVWNSDQGFEKAKKAFDASRKKLDTDVVDLYLVHWPVQGMFVDTWKALEELYNAGKIRAIGVSNFLVHQLTELMDNSAVKPVINQVEFHPFLLQRELLEFDHKNGIAHEAWGPLTKGKYLDNPVLTDIAENHGKTPAQVLIRWDIQHEVVTIPKSVHRERIYENADVFDFELTDEEMERIDSLDEGRRMGPDPSHVDFQ